eukprot:scaffold18913_cov111-Isochrysis_galbana.AAC.1
MSVGGLLVLAGCRRVLAGAGTAGVRNAVGGEYPASSMEASHAGTRTRSHVVLFTVRMEHPPADARAAPSASEPNDTVMDIASSPKKKNL